jgi:microcystin-dependent protein
VGAIVGVGGGALNPAVDPATPTNPNYALLGTAGANTVTLNLSQIPSHTHIATVNDPEHTHITDFKASQADLAEPGASGILMNRDPVFNSTAATTSAATGITVTNASAGSGSAHSNIQPVLACYYIMYIP